MPEWFPSRKGCLVCISTPECWIYLHSNAKHSTLEREEGNYVNPYLERTCFGVLILGNSTLDIDSRLTPKVHCLWVALIQWAFERRRAETSRWYSQIILGRCLMVIWSAPWSTQFSRCWDELNVLKCPLILIRHLEVYIVRCILSLSATFKYSNVGNFLNNSFDQATWFKNCNF